MISIRKAAQMSKLGLLTVVLLAVLALGVVVVNSAQANPKLATGYYMEGSGGASKLAAGSEEIHCTANTVTAAFGVGGEEGSATFKFTGCKTGEGAKCKTEGAATEEWVLGPVPIDLVAIVTHTLAGFLVSLGSIKVKCGVLPVNVLGSLILHAALANGVPVTPTENVSVEGKGSEGKQEFRTCEEPAGLCGEGPFEPKAEFVEGKPESAVETLSDEVKLMTTVAPEF